MSRSGQNSNSTATKLAGHILPSKTLFLKIMKSDPKTPTSYYFEDMCVASYSVSGKDLDVILKFRDVTEDRIRKTIEIYDLYNYIASPFPIHAKVIKEEPINYSTTQKDLGFIFVRCDPVNVEKISDVIRKRAYQVFETDDEYNLWAIFAEDRVHFYDLIFGEIYTPSLSAFIEHSFVAFVLNARKMEVPPSVGILQEIRGMLTAAKGTKGYWNVSLDMIKIFLEGEFSIPEIASKLPRYRRTTLYKSKDRLLNKGFIRESRKEGRTTHYTINEKKYPNLCWLLKR